MVALILALIVIAILFGAGAALHALWWIAIIALAIWLIGFAFRPGGRTWYYW
ncbi:MAG: hydrophobic protein [Candidatus Dormibacteraeota bacterium]|nr:hydrophobic protein [Candidatus Dormibacteraeota bacterium]MBV9525424.1 hydrophobic protein [Candidatus Dormibacteraeota bacterium]